MDYTALVADASTTGSIKSWINYSRLDAPGILEEAQAWIYSRIRVRQMVSSADISITSGASTAAYPTGYLDPIHLGIPGVVPRIRLRDIEWFRTTLGWDETAAMPSGVPTFWTDIGELIQFNTAADQAYTAKMVYFKTPTALGPSNLTNFLTTKYPTLLRRTCLMFAAEARKEYDLMDREEQRAMIAVQEVNVESDRAMRGLELDFHWSDNE